MGEKKLADEKIRAIVRKHFAEDFPNPERRGCPRIHEIKRAADELLEGKDRVLGHISFCSPWLPGFFAFSPGQKTLPRRLRHSVLTRRLTQTF